MTDARSLTLFLRGRTHNNMLDRMSLMIAPYQPKITWLKGTDNKISDMISRMPMVTNDTKLVPHYDRLEIKTGDLPEILESCSTPQREILCKSMGLIDEVSEDGKIKLSMVDSSLHGGPETRLKKKMRLLKQNQEEMDGETYAKELTNEQYDRIMWPINDLVLRDAQNADASCQDIKRLMKGKKAKGDKYLLVNDIIHKIIVHEGMIHSPIVIPESLRKWCLEDHHLLLGHAGQKRLYGYLKRKFYWKNMDADVQKTVTGCGLCKQASMKQDQYPRLPTGVPQKPFDKIAIDLVGPLRKSHMGNVYIITMMDIFSGWPEAEGIPDKRAEMVGLTFQRMFLSRHSFPLEVLSDRGSEWISSIFQDILGAGNTKHIKTSSYTPSSNGKLERFHSFLMAGVRKLAYRDVMSWDVYLPEVLWAYRVMPGPTGLSPFYLTRGYDMRMKLDILLDPSPVYTGDEVHFQFFQNCRTLWQMARGLILKYRKESEYNASDEPDIFKVGDLVSVKIHVRDKLVMKWSPPQYRVISLPSKCTLILECIHTGKHLKISVKHAKKCDPDALWLIPDTNTSSATHEET